MVDLVASKVMRKGATEPQDRFVEVNTDVSVIALSVQGLVPWQTGIQIGFSIPAKGGGKTAIIVDLAVEDYEALAAAMLYNNAPVALRAFAKAIESHSIEIRG